MNIHKRTRLTLLDRQEIWRLYQTRLWKVVHLAEHFHVSRPTIYDTPLERRSTTLSPTPPPEIASPPIASRL